MKAATITIGTEILIGQIIDTNAAYLGKQLNDLGFEIVKNISISDDKESIIQTLQSTTKDVDIIIITGGLGPTKDDITKASIAEFLGVEMEYKAEIYELIKKIFAHYNREPNEMHKEQCYFPKGTKFLQNSIGTAPGMLFTYNGTTIISMPGVPYEMKHIFESHVIPLLHNQQKEYYYHKTIMTIGRGESDIADEIEDIENNLPKYISLAYLPSLGRVRIRLSGKYIDQKALTSTLDQEMEKINQRLGDIVFGYDEEDLTEAIGKMLKERNMKMATAESCTGGYVANIITNIPGASAYFAGSIVSYSNDLKHHLLQVSRETIKNYGAVSEQTVEEMVSGLIKVTNADVGIAISGIAGPGGGTEEKPVGTIWIAVGDKDKIYTKMLSLRFERLQNIEYSAFASLNMLRKFLRRK